MTALSKLISQQSYGISLEYSIIRTVFYNHLRNQQVENINSIYQPIEIQIKF
jgi:hypothetical protein